MPELLIAPAASDSEVDEALRLACQVFSENNTAANYRDYKAVLWRDDPAFASHNVLIARTRAGALAGLIRVIPRRLRRAGQSMRVAGISSVCVKPEFRGRGYSVPLMEHALEHCRSLGFDVAFLIARRAADHYYTQFGFWGVSSYNRLSITRSAAPGGTPAAIAFPPARREWIDCYRSAHVECYADSFGWFERDRSYWDFLLKRLSLLPGVEFRGITRHGTPLGYVVKGNGLIHEVAFLDALPAAELVHALAPSAGDAALTLQLDLPPEHRLCRMLQNFDCSIRYRECTYGGHMLRILNADRVADLLAERVTARLGALGCTPLSGGAEGIAIRWDGKQCRVELSTQARKRPGYEQSCILLGALSLSGNRADSVDRLLPFNISFCDQV